MIVSASTRHTGGRLKLLRKHTTLKTPQTLPQLMANISFLSFGGTAAPCMVILFSRADGIVRDYLDSSTLDFYIQIFELKYGTG